MLHCIHYQLQSEIKIHRTLRHIHVVRFERYFEDSTNVYMLLELCTNNSMSELLKRRKRLSDIETRYYLTQLIGSLKYLHDNLVIHRDLKLGNLFVDAQMRIKVGDFGLATKVTDVNERKKTVCGTPNYIAPEILEGKNGHSFEVDVWSTGVILYTLLIGKPPFESKDVKSTYKRILANSFVFPDHIPICEHAKNLIRHVLQTKPESRPSLDEMLEHSYFSRPSAFTPLQLPESALREPPQYSTAHMEQQQQQLELAASKKAAGYGHPEAHILVNDENDPNTANRQHPPSHSINSLAHPSYQMNKPKTSTSSFLPEQPSQVRPRTAPSTHNPAGGVSTIPGPLSSVNNNGAKYTHQTLTHTEESTSVGASYRHHSTTNNSNGGFLDGTNTNSQRSISTSRPMTAGASSSSTAGGGSNGSSLLLPGVNTNGGGSLSTQKTRLAQGQGLAQPTLVRSSSRSHSAGPAQGQGLGGSSSSSMAPTGGAGDRGVGAGGSAVDKRPRDGFQIYQDNTTTATTTTTNSNPFKLAAPVGNGNGSGNGSGNIKSSSSSHTLTNNNNDTNSLHGGLRDNHHSNGNSGDRGTSITTRSHSNNTHNAVATVAGSGHGMQPREPAGRSRSSCE